MLSRSPSRANDGMLQIEQPPTKRVRLTAPSPDQSRHREIGLMRWRSEKDAASFVGSASGIHFIRSVYSAVEAEKSRAATPAQSPDRNLVPGEDDQLPGDQAEQLQTLWQSHEVLQLPRSGNEVVGFEQLLVWADSYFENWHPAYPFLHAPRILDLFRKIAGLSLAHLDRLDPLDLAILRSIFSISLADRRQCYEKPASQPIPIGLVFPDFDAAIKSVQATLAAATTIKALQAVIGVQLFLVSMLRHNAASRLGGLAVRMAFQIGLHRCPVRYNSFTAEDIQLRKRVFFCIYCIDRHLCQSLGLPLTIRDDDVDLCLPNEEKHASNVGVNIGIDDRLSLLSFLARVADIKGLIMELCNKSISHRQTDVEATTSIVAKMRKWQNDIEIFLEDTLASSSASHHRTTLTVLRHECTISLNRPLLALPKDTSDYEAALQSCIGAARSIIAQLHEDLKSVTPPGHVSNGKSTTRPLLWPSFTWATWQSAFILLYAAVEGELPKDSAIKLADHSGEILKHIALRGGVWPTACAAAISDLRKHLDRPRTSTRPLTEIPQTDVDVQAEAINRLSTLAGVAETHGRPWMQHAEHISNPMESQLPSVNLNGDILNHQLPPIVPGFEQHGNGGMVGYGTAFGPEAIFDMNDPELFNGFDIPFWLDDGQYNSIFNEGG